MDPTSFPAGLPPRPRDSRNVLTNVTLPSSATWGPFSAVTFHECMRGIARTRACGGRRGDVEVQVDIGVCPSDAPRRPPGGLRQLTARLHGQARESRPYCGVSQSSASERFQRATLCPFGGFSMPLGLSAAATSPIKPCMCSAGYTAASCPSWQWRALEPHDLNSG